MKIRKHSLFALLLSGTVITVVGYRITTRHSSPAVALGPYRFRVVDLSCLNEPSADRHWPKDQLWLTVQVDPSDPHKEVHQLHAYLPRLLQHMELIGPDGSHQKPFASQTPSSISWFDSIRKIGRSSRLQMRFGFDNRAHWKTVTLSAHFDSSQWQMTDPEEMSVSGKTLYLSSIKIP